MGGRNLFQSKTDTRDVHTYRTPTAPRRLAWHETLFTVNEQMVRELQPLGTGLSTSPSLPPAVTATVKATCMSSDGAGARPSSTLTPPKVVSSFLFRELVLSEKVAAVLMANERGGALGGVCMCVW